MAVTANDITDAAYRKIGLLQPVSADDTNALFALNNILSQWGAEGIVTAKVDVATTLTASTREYTIGSGGDIDTVRPLAIDQAYIRVDTTDYGLKIVSCKQIGSILSKQVEGRPSSVALLSEYPLAKLVFDCPPDTAYAVYFTFHNPVTRLALITTDVDMPEPVYEALIYNLAIRLAEDKSIALPRSVYEIAAQSKALCHRLFALNRPAVKSAFTEVSAILGASSDAGIHWES